MKRLVVLGATGTLGRRLVALARRELPGLEIVAASRRGGPVEGARSVALDLADAAALGRELAGGDGLLVNCVGPYVYDPGPLVRACVETGCHYADLAETPAFLEAVAVAAASCGAAERGVTLVPGASTAPGLIELLAQHWSARSEVVGIDAWLSLGSDNPLGAGMLAGLLRPLGRTGPEGAHYFRGTRKRRGLRYGRYPSGFAGERLRLGAREVPVRFFVGFDRGLLVSGLALAAPGLARLSDPALARLARLALPAARAVRRLGTRQGSLVIQASGAGEAIEMIAEDEGLDVPAAPALWVARALHAGAALPRGSVALRDVVPLADAVAWLRHAGYPVRGLP